MNLLRLLQSVHGHVGILATVALIHPAMLLWRGLPLTHGRRWAISLSTGLTCLAFAMGVFIYGDYRRHLRRELFATDATSGLLFESKEHLAFAVVTLALAGLASAFAAPGGAEGKLYRESSARLFAASALLCAVVSGLGTWITSLVSF